MSFGLRVSVGLIVWCGLAVLDVGSRAQAAFWTSLSGPRPWVVAGGTGSGSVDPDNSQVSTRRTPLYPLKDGVFRPLVAHGNLNGGGAGAPATVSTVGGSTAPALPGTLVVPDICCNSSERLRPVELRNGSCSLLTSIFEPPRV